MINGENDLSSTLGGKNVYLVTPPYNKQQIHGTKYTTSNQPNVNLASAQDNIPHRRINPSNNTSSQITKPLRYRIEDDGPSKHSGNLPNYASL